MDEKLISDVILHELEISGKASLIGNPDMTERLIDADVVKRKNRKIKLSFILIAAAAAVAVGAAMLGLRRYKDENKENRIDNYFVEDDNFNYYSLSDNFSDFAHLTPADDGMFLSAFYSGPDPDEENDSNDTGSDLQQRGQYILKTDNEGNLKSEYCLGDSRILKIRRSGNNSVYVLAAGEEDGNDETFFVLIPDRKCRMKEKICLDIDNEEMMQISLFCDFIIEDDTVSVIAECSQDDISYYEIMYFDMDGNMKGKTEYRDISVFKFFESAGNIYAVCRNSERSFISAVDTDNKELVEKKSLKYNIESAAQFSEGNDEYDLFINFYDGVYGYRMSDNSLTECVNWLDSGIDRASLVSFGMNSSNRISFVYSENYWGGSLYNINSYTRADDETLNNFRNRKEINAAFLCTPDEEIYSCFNDINKDSDEYRIHIDDYTKYSTDDDISGMSRLESEIKNGNIPDMIFAGSRFDWLKYCADGTLENIDNYFGKDEEFERDKYFENIFDAYKYDGIQFAIPINFEIRCMTSKKSVTGDRTGYTCEELENIENNGNLFSDERYESVIDMFVSSNITEYVDFKSGKCDFDNKDFITLLNIIKRNCDSDDINIDNSVLETAVPENIKLFNLFPVCGYKDLRISQQIYTGEEMSYVGYPSSKESLPLVSSECCIGITAASEYKMEAGELIEYLISDYIQENADTHMSGDQILYDGAHFSVSRAVFENNAFRSMRGVPSVYCSSSGEKKIKLNEIDQETVDDLKNTVNKINRAALYDSGIAEIISEEFDSFIENRQTAEETAEKIQNKVSGYLKKLK